MSPVFAIYSVAAIATAAIWTLATYANRARMDRDHFERHAIRDSANLKSYETFMIDYLLSESGENDGPAMARDMLREIDSTKGEPNDAQDADR